MDLYIYVCMYVCWMHEHTVKMGNRMAELKEKEPNS